jgi:N-carbamoyl-L-amino-acid hydrolase
VVVFTDEEGGLVGSRAWIGDLTEATLGIVSHSGMTIRDGLVAVGGDPRRLDAVVRKKGDITAFIELHIEQGAFLDDGGIDIGVVEGIVGINWWDVVIEGIANHAGTTPMNKRTDALLAAAEYVLAVNEVVTGVAGRQVGTVGKISAEPGAHNVIPGRVLTSLEIRDLDADKTQMIYERILERVKKIEESSGTVFTFTALDATAVPAPTDERMRDIIQQAAVGLGLSTLRLPSAAGHDAQDMAKIAPTGMIFVPSRGGISHSPEEFTSKKDLANGANVLLHTVLSLDRGALDRDR